MELPALYRLPQGGRGRAGGRELRATLRIPNEEIFSVFERLFLSFLREGLGGQRQVDAQAQLRDRDYAAELRALGATPIHLVAVAFDGKKVLVG